MAAACLAFIVVPSGAAAATSIVECGQLVAYIAPDPGTPTDGSLTIGALAPWVIAADAGVGANAATVLPASAGNGPTCVALDLDDADVVTAIDIAPGGTISGDVLPYPDVDGYVIADRLLLPSFVTDAYPELAAVFVTSAATGTPVTAAFSVDVTSGAFTSIHVTASFCGKASLDAQGDGHVGKAVLPAAVLDPSSSLLLEKAEGHRRCAAVVVDGNVGQELELAADVTITGGPQPDPPDTATAGASPDVPQALSPTFMATFGLLAAALALVAASVRPAQVRGRRERRDGGQKI